MNYKIVEIRETDNIEICALFEKIFNKPMGKQNSIEIFPWLFFENVYKKNYCKALSDGKKILAYWGFIPVDCKINNKIMKGSLSFHLVSNQKVLGASPLLWRKIKKDLIIDSVNISFTIINESSYLLLKNMGWVVEMTPVLISFVHPFKLINDLISRIIKPKMIRRIFSRVIQLIDYLFSKLMKLSHAKYDNVKEVRCFDENYNKLWNSMSKSMAYGVNLDFSYVNWRYVNKPNNTYKILSYVDNDRIIGYLIYDIKKEFGTNIGYIMDIIADPSDINVINSLIKCAKGQLFQEGVAMVSALSFKQNIFYKNLKGTGFFNLPNKFLPHKSYFTFYNFLGSENNFNLNKWHISWGNHDNK